MLQSLHRWPLFIVSCRVDGSQNESVSLMLTLIVLLRYWLSSPGPVPQPFTVTVHLTGSLGSAKRPAVPLCPQHLLRKTVGPEPGWPPQGAEHWATTRDTQCHQKARHLRRTGMWNTWLYFLQCWTNQKHFKCNTLEFFWEVFICTRGSLTVSP